jgi:hypothetical protein
MNTYLNSKYSKWFQHDLKNIQTRLIQNFTCANLNFDKKQWKKVENPSEFFLQTRNMKFVTAFTNF